MSHLLLFGISFIAWLIDIALQAVYYFGMSPFGAENYGSDAALFYVPALYYSACFMIVFSLPGLIAWTSVRRKQLKHQQPVKMPGWILVMHAVLLTLLICLNHSDHEILRFMGTRYSLEMLKAYNVFSDTSSFVLGTLATDARGAYSSLMLFGPPLIFLILVIAFRKKLAKFICSFEARTSRLVNRLATWGLYLGIVVMIVSALSVFIKEDPILGVRWQPNRKQVRVSPIPIALIEDIRESIKIGNHDRDYSTIDQDIQKFQALWSSEELDPNWHFVSSDLPLQKNYVGTCPQVLDGKKPNFVVLFFESSRAMNLPDFNPEVVGDPMPYLHSLIDGSATVMQKHALRSAWFDRYYTSGLPTVDAQMATHLGIPAHSFFTVSSTFTLNAYPTYASILRDHGYYTTFIDSADGGFTNWSMWIHRWYDQFVDLRTKDDKDTLQSLGDLILERRKTDQPFLITAITISNHVPFTVPEGGLQPPEEMPFRDRMNYTLRYSDDQLKAFFERLSEADALSNTVFILLADHGYALDDIPKDQFFGENYDSLRYNVAWVPMVMLSDLTVLPEGRQSHVASHVDLAPTILNIAGFCDDNSFVGHSLVQPSPHHILVNKNNNFLYRNDEYTAIYVVNSRPQLFRTDDVTQKNDLWQQESAVVDQFRAEGESYRRVIDYAYETNRIPVIGK